MALSDPLAAAHKAHSGERIPNSARLPGSGTPAGVAVTSASSVSVGVFPLPVPRVMVQVPVPPEKLPPVPVLTNSKLGQGDAGKRER